MAELISVIVATYNRADALDAMLRSLARQAERRAEKNFEIVVADDGSGPQTRELIADMDAAVLAFRSGMSGRKTAAFASPKSAIARLRRARATI